MTDKSGGTDEANKSPPPRQRRSSVAESASTATTTTPTCSDHPRVMDASCRPPSARRKFRTLTFGRHYGKTNATYEGGGTSGGKDGLKKKRKSPWTFRFNYRLRRDPATDILDPNSGSVACVCTGYRRTEEHHLGAGLVFKAEGAVAEGGRVEGRLDDQQSMQQRRLTRPLVSTVFDVSVYDAYPIEDCEDRARAERARELEEGVDPPPGYRPSSVSPLLSSRRTHQFGGHLLAGTFDLRLSDLAAALQSRLTVQPRQLLVASSPTGSEPSSGSAVDRASAVPNRRINVHTQVDYIHCLVPDLLDITCCAFYWGKMDRYEAERLLEGRPEGTFLLRDSAQEEFLFSVSFRRYGRSLHARVEQWNHQFSFDSHDPCVYSSSTVCGLVEHYKDPTCCMFFEPMLTVPLNRTFPFPLQHLCRAAIAGTRLAYDGVNELRLPKPLKAYLKEYHYKQRVRVRLLE